MLIFPAPFSPVIYRSVYNQMRKINEKIKGLTSYSIDESIVAALKLWAQIYIRYIFIPASFYWYIFFFSSFDLFEFLYSFDFNSIRRMSIKDCFWQMMNAISIIIKVWREILKSRYLHNKYTVFGEKLYQLEILYRSG